ncbi:MAG: response regulator [Bacteroidales bacterium]|nr:response regulator [Bacteroidales bacterium]
MIVIVFLLLVASITSTILYLKSKSSLKKTLEDLDKGNKISEELRRVIDSSNLKFGIWNFNDDSINWGNSIHKNDLHSENLKQSNINSVFSKVLNPDKSRILNILDSFKKDSSEKIDFEISVQENEAIRHFEVIISPYTKINGNKENTPIGNAMIVYRDISKIKIIENELKKEKEKAEESNKLKSAYLANMSHEIRTPLNAIVGFSNILADSNDPQEKEQCVSIIENNNDLLIQLINDILDLAKIEAGTLDFNFSNVDLNTLVQQAQQAAFLKVDKRRVDVRCILGAEDCIIKSDYNRLLQVVSNFMSNAIKFTQKGSITIGYSKDDEKEKIRLYVKDTGCGIKKENQKSIFERFIKLNSMIPGTGLGLSICYNIINRLNGTIGVESEENTGSEFWIELPFDCSKKVCDKDEIITSSKKSIIKSFKLNLSNHKPILLVAEDDISNIRLYKALLKNDFEMIHAKDGEEAIEMFIQHNPDLVLMDIKMPKCDGYEALEKIRQISSNIPIIAVTAYAYSGEIRKMFDAGFNDCIVKPVNKKELFVKIDKYLNYIEE